jgi:hypothetical protein
VLAPTEGLGGVALVGGVLHWTTLSRLQKTCRACGASFSLDHGGGTASRSEDHEILSVITEGDLPKSVTDPDEGPPTSNGNPSPLAI